MRAWSGEDVAAITGGTWARAPVPGAAWTGVGIDSRADLTDRLFVALRGDRHDGHDHLADAVRAGATALVVERTPTRAPPGAPGGVPILRVGDARGALARLASAHRTTLTGTTVIAVTGSCGKTSTKHMLHHVLSAIGPGHAAPRSFNNDVGVPLTLLGTERTDRYVVVEIGTNAPGEVATLARITRPDVAVITNVGRAHLGGFGSVAAIAREKAALLDAIVPPGLAVLPCDGPLGDLSPDVPCVRVGADAEAHVQMTARGYGDGGAWLEIGGTARFEIGLPGAAMARNALAVIAVARRMGMDDASIAARLRAVQPAPLRLARTRIGERDVLNDAYNANPESMRAALDVFAETTSPDRPRALVLGDMLELGDSAAELHGALGDELAGYCREHGVTHVVLVGTLVGETAGAIRIASANAVEVVHVPAIDATTLPEVDCAVPARASVLLKASRGIGLERLANHWAASPARLGVSIAVCCDTDS